MIAQPLCPQRHCGVGTDIVRGACKDAPGAEIQVGAGKTMLEASTRRSRWANSVHWVSTGKAVEGGELSTIEIKGNRSALGRFEIDDVQLESSNTGARVVINTVTTEAATAFDEITAIRQRLLTEFALHLAGVSGLA